jgi:oxygen-independent coproporphyrinogen-3 oxidase
MYEAIPKLLAKDQLYQYEISNYAKTNCQCQHNVNVWQGGLLLGIGPSAAGFDGINRYSYECNIVNWIKGIALKDIDEIPIDHRLAEIFAVNLRTVKGWDKDIWAKVPNSDSWENRLAIAQSISKRYPKLWDIQKDNIKLTKLGRLYWDTIAEELLP